MNWSAFKCRYLKVIAYYLDNYFLEAYEHYDFLKWMNKYGQV